MDKVIAPIIEDGKVNHPISLGKQMWTVFVKWFEWFVSIKTPLEMTSTISTFLESSTCLIFAHKFADRQSYFLKSYLPTWEGQWKWYVLTYLHINIGVFLFMRVD